MSRTNDIKLFSGYSIRIAEDAKEFEDFFNRNRPAVFSNDVDLRLSAVLTHKEKSKIKELSKNRGTLYRLSLYILHRGKEIGWLWGEQDGAHAFHMINTAIFKQHQNKGIYTSLLPKVVDILREKGFQTVYSEHKATNNQVIIPKLRLGFVITALELSDIFGVLVRLTYYFNKDRRKVIDFRAGKGKPGLKIRKALSLDKT